MTDGRKDKAESNMPDDDKLDRHVDQLDRLKDKLDREHNENIQRLTRIESGLSQVDEKLVDNKEILSDMNIRISALEKWVWRATGALAIGFGIVNFIIVILQLTKK